MKKRINFGMVFALGVGAWYLWKQAKAAQAAKALAAPAATASASSMTANESASAVASH